MYTEIEKSFETVDGGKVNKEWCDTISHNQKSGSEFKRIFVKSKKENFFSQCIKKLQKKSLP